MDTARARPTGTVTFLFTDIEGSTRLAQTIGTDRYGELLERHRAELRAAFGAAGGAEIGTEGDSFFVVFERPIAAASAAADGQRRLATHDWPADAIIRVRMGLHTGEGVLTADGTYVGNDVNRAARIAAAGHGGQVVLSEATAALLADSPPSGTRLNALGEHRLKDLRPERLYQLVVEGLRVDFPPIRSLDSRPNNLPTQLTSFVGREREVADVVRLLGSARLVTLTGPGGTGKTRLSIQVAAEVAEGFEDGATFVALAPISDPDLVASAIATTLGLPDVGGRAPRDRVADHLRAREHLLVLDNFEQVAEAAPLLADLLREARRMRILVSSRIVLRISGEQEFPVPPLDLPETRADGPADPSDSPAVRLFVDRARAVRPEFELTPANRDAVAEIVARLDGLPLAIELAAARVRLLTPEAMLPRLERRLDLAAGALRDVPGRQQTLRGAIAWSHDLLEEPDRRLFARFAVFVGGAGLDEAELVCGTESELGRPVLDGLDGLIQQSLVRQAGGDGEVRFAMLETIGAYATEKLAESGEREAIRRRHAEAFRDLAERAAPELTARDQKRWLDRLALEHDNLRAALAFAVEAGDPELGLRLVAALWRFWQIRGHLVEGTSRADAVLALPGAARAGEPYIVALDAAGGLRYWQADFDGAQRRYEEVLEARRGGGDERAIAEALYNLSFTELFGRADMVRARQLGEEALAAFRRVGDRGGEARAHWQLANVGRDQGDLAAARQHCLEAIELLRAQGLSFMLAWSLFTLGQVETLDGHLETGASRFLEALELFAGADDMSGFVLVLDALAMIAWQSGDRHRAARLSGAVRQLEAATGTGLNRRNRASLRFDPLPLRDDPATAAAWLEGTRWSTDEAVAYAREAVAPGAPGRPVAAAGAAEVGREARPASRG